MRPPGVSGTRMATAPGDDPPHVTRRFCPPLMPLSISLPTAVSITWSMASMRDTSCTCIKGDTGYVGKHGHAWM